MVSMRSCMNLLKKVTKNRSGGQLAPLMTPTECRRLSDRKATKENMASGQLAPVMMHVELGLPQPVPHPDPYYGHERTARMSARFIQDLFKSSGVFYLNGSPDYAYPTLDEFIAHALFTSESDLYVHYYAMYLIWRMHIKHPELRAHHSHETYLAALMLATRVVTPEKYASESWDRVGQSVFRLERLRANEQRLCEMVGWEVEVDEALVWMIEEQVEMKYAESPVPFALGSWETSEGSESDDSSSLFSVETPDTSPLPSDSPSPSSDSNRRMPLELLQSLAVPYTHTHTPAL